MAIDTVIKGQKSISDSWLHCGTLAPLSWGAAIKLTLLNGLYCLCLLLNPVSAKSPSQHLFCYESSVWRLLLSSSSCQLVRADDEEAKAKAGDGFIGLICHAPCETSLQSSLLKVLVKKKWVWKSRWRPFVLFFEIFSAYEHQRC